MALLGADVNDLELLRSRLVALSTQREQNSVELRGVLNQLNATWSELPQLRLNNTMAEIDRDSRRQKDVIDGLVDLLTKFIQAMTDTDASLSALGGGSSD